MFCGKCRQVNVDGTRYCIACGTDLASQTPRRPADVTLDGAATVSTVGLGPGRVLAQRYEVLSLVGTGGMGEVWKAVDREMLGMAVAVKVLPPVLAHNKRSIEALRREAVISLRLSHPSVCRLHTFHSDGDTKFLVMEYLEGRTLEALLDERPGRKLGLAETVAIAKQVAEALEHAHGQPAPSCTAT